MKRSTPSTKAIERFGALAQPTRLTALRQLLSAYPDTLSAGEIARRCRVPHNTMSAHLGILTRAGLIEVARDGRTMNYQANAKEFQELISFIALDCCKGRPEVCGPDLAAAFQEVEIPLDPLIPAFNVLFLCTHNSARSIMAEALMEKVGSGRFRAYSAGTEPAREPLHDVVRQLGVLGHDTTQLRCKPWSEFKGPNAPRMDFVIALCDVPHAVLREQLGGPFVMSAWPLPDPAQFNGPASERTTLLNELYGMIRRRIEMFANLPIQSMGRSSLKASLDEIGSRIAA